MIVVTGGAGFIGSNVVASLAERGTRDIVVCDRFGDGDKWRNVAKHEVADFVDPLDLFPFLDENRPDGIVHMGAISATTETDVDKILENNFCLSADLWDWCTQHEVRLIYASSAATYGDGENGFDDDASPQALAKLRPMNPYGWSKHAFDRRVARAVYEGRPTPPQWAGLKFFNVYGPNEYHKGTMRSVVCQIAPHAAEGEAVRLFRSHDPDYADGGQMRDFIYVRDCADVILWLLDNKDVSGIFNLGTGSARSFSDLAHAVFAALNRSPSIKFVDTPADIRERYQYFTEASMTRLREAGYTRSFTALEDGVAEYVRDYLMAADPYR